MPLRESGPAEELDIKSLIDRFKVQEIAKRHNYAPSPTTTSSIDLGIDWGTLDVILHIEDFVGFHCGSILSNTYRENLLTSTTGERPALATANVDTWKGLVPRGDPSMLEDIRGTTYVYVYSREQKEGNNLVANFQINRGQTRENDWFIPHRIVKESFREQGIGSHLLKICESLMQAQANRSNAPQRLMVNPGQLEVLGFFLKHEYRPTGDSGGRILQELIEAESPTTDPNGIVIKSRPQDKNNPDNKMQGFMFYGDVMQEAGFNLWEKEVRMNFIEIALKVELGKVFIPQKAAEPLHIVPMVDKV